MKIQMIDAIGNTVFEGEASSPHGNGMFPINILRGGKLFRFTEDRRNRRGSDETIVFVEQTIWHWSEGAPS